MTDEIETPENTNHLIEEKSPYLLQHAHNPVDWYAWGEEAFMKAREEDKPVFLSIGYSTCHWCHVMAHESFENREIAALINKFFIPIKVDREERPDIDDIYMKVCQLLTGSGGWPLSIFLTPDRKPFFAATYIPRESKLGRKGMKDLLPEIGELWQREKEKALESADKITDILQNESETDTFRGQKTVEEQTDNTLIEKAYDQLESSFDNKYGGFGKAPKFPVPHKLLFLLRYWKRTDEESALNMVEQTLLAMRGGGIYDQLGSGFHRYATDRKWLLPHFEKMLYDNALITYLYTEVYQATAKSIYRKTAGEIISYLIGEMQSPEGGFYSAEDADSEGEEGKFYVWSEDDIKEILSSDEAEAVIDLYHIKKEGNFTGESSGQKTGNNILYVNDILYNLEKIEQLQPAREKLLKARDKRIHPHKDDKILTDWNGLTAAALAKAGWTFNDRGFIEAAEKAVNFITDNLINEQGRLLHRYREGESSITANLDDYSFFIWGLIELYQASFKSRYLKLALRLHNQQQKHFRDQEKGGYFFTPDDGEDLLIRPKNIYDGALPSGNSVALWNLVRLAHLTGDQSLEEEAAAIYNNFYSTIKNNPASYCQLLSGVDGLINPFYDIVITGKEQDKLTISMFDNIRCSYIPGRVIIFRPQPADNTENDAIEEIAPFIREYKRVNNQTTAYICKDYSCQLPVNDVEHMLTLLDVD